MRALLALGNRCRFESGTSHDLRSLRGGGETVQGVSLRMPGFNLGEAEDNSPRREPWVSRSKPTKPRERRKKPRCPLRLEFSAATPGLALFRLLSARAGKGYWKFEERGNF